jgi:hypothetical protein
MSLLAAFLKPFILTACLLVFWAARAAASKLPDGRLKRLLLLRVDQ